MGDEFETTHYAESNSWSNAWTNVPSPHSWPKPAIANYSPYFDSSFGLHKDVEQTSNIQPNLSNNNEGQWSTNWGNPQIPQIPQQTKPSKTLTKKDNPLHDLEKLAFAVSELTIEKEPAPVIVPPNQQQETPFVDEIEGDSSDVLSTTSEERRKKVNIEEELAKQSLYKTELCRSYVETGACRYGHKCQFAHGEHELRSILRHPKYKTEFCKRFTYNGICPYGNRCRFIHPTPEYYFNSKTSSTETNKKERRSSVSDAKFSESNLPNYDLTNNEVQQPWAPNRSSRTSSDPARRPEGTVEEIIPTTTNKLIAPLLDDRPGSSEGRRLSFFQNLAN